MNVIGFTGTRSGMSDEQEQCVRKLVGELILSGYGQVVHGNCVGADAQFDAIARDWGLEPACYPAVTGSLQANTGAVPIAPPDSPMRRNRAIVADAGVMIACPPNDTPIKRGSGTWATIGFAKKAGKPLAIVFPDGRVEKSGNWAALDHFPKGGQ